MPRFPLIACGVCLLLLLLMQRDGQSDATSPAARADLSKRLAKQIAELDAQIADSPNSTDLYSRRGDAHFFSGHFDAAVADYEQMVKLDPDLETSHWRRGIAYFYAGRYRDAAHQFEIYHTFDDVDRENGIWRYLSQAQAYGIEKAREGLLKYQKDDREPFPAVYQLFAGKTTAAEILKQIEAAKLSDSQRTQRLFYAQLYIGLNYVIEKQPKLAEEHLRAAVENTWGPTAGYGPAYMWHVGRVHYELLQHPAKP